MTCGAAHRSGNRTAVREQLRNRYQIPAAKDLATQQIQASAHAFHAILGDGSVVVHLLESWIQDPWYDGDGCVVQYQLQNVLPMPPSYEALLRS